MAAMLRTLIGVSSAILAVAACGKKDKVDCAAYAEHLADINTRGLEGADRERPQRTVRISAEESCRSGRVKAAEVSCVMSANSADQARECAGLAPLTAQPPAPSATATPSPATRAKTRGLSIAVSSGWKIEKPSNPREGELLIREDKPDTDTHVSGGVFVSRGPAKIATTEDECATKGHNMEHPPAKLRSTKLRTSALGTTCHIELNDDRMVILSDSIGVASGEAVIFNCYHDINDAGPPPACAEMFASIKLED
jgi:hypothetical protein